MQKAVRPLDTRERAFPLARGGGAMNITSTELYQFCMIVIGIIGLCIQTKKK